MNWTEGNLARHSRPSKARDVLLRQKEYFAKARAGLLNANLKFSPPSISAFAHPARSSPTHHGPSGSRSSALSSSKKRNRDRSPLRISKYFEDDDGLKLSTVADFQEDQVEEEVLRQKRRKLLLKGDWTGISLQKPIKTEFSKPQAPLGGPWTHSKSRHAKSKSRMRHALGTEHDGEQNTHPKTTVRATVSTSPHQLRVRVGSRERVFGGSSNVSPRSETCRDGESSSQVSRNLEPSYNAHRASSPVSHADHQSPKLPELLQPLPKRPYLPPIFHSPSSDPDDGASTKARVGVLEPDVPSDRVEENEAWRRLVGGAKPNQLPSDSQPSFNCDAGAAQTGISPGISQAGLSKTIDISNGQAKLVEESPGITTGTGVYAEVYPQRQEGLLPSHELEVSPGKALETDDASFAADAASSSSTWSSPLRSKQNSGNDGHKAAAGQLGLPDDADKVSLRGMPTSNSPISEDLLAQFHNYRKYHDNMDDGVAPSALPGTHPTENNQGISKLPIQQHGPVPDKQLAKPLHTEKDENEVWMKLVFGDFVNDDQGAFEEALKQTVRNICCSDPTTSTDEGRECENTQLYAQPSETTAALSSDHHVYVPDFTDPYDSSSIETTTMAPVSSMATFGDSSPDPLAAPDLADLYIGVTVEKPSPDSRSPPNPAKSDGEMRSDEVNFGTSSSSNDVSPGFVDKVPSRSDAWSPVTSGHDNASMVAHPPSASEQSEADDSFKFTRPKPFLGKKIHLDDERQIALSVPQIRGKVVIWRRQKRTRDGRASIRDMPDFKSDPIEEVEDVVSVKGAQKSSLFGSLVMEDEVC